MSNRTFSVQIAASEGRVFTVKTGDYVASIDGECFRAGQIRLLSRTIVSPRGDHEMRFGDVWAVSTETTGGNANDQ